MFRNCLAADFGSGCELFNRNRSAGAQDIDQAQASLVAERCEDRCVIRQRRVLLDGALWRGDMLFNALHLFVPALAVHAECFQATGRRYIVKSGFDDDQ